MPPKIIPGVISAGTAFFAAIKRSRVLLFSALFIERHLSNTTPTMNSNKIKPGTIPAANVCETGTFVRALNKIAALEGGINASNRAAEAASTTTKGFG